MKNSYILLRNNEESGPFEFEDLQRMGLQPGDLIWVEGQSVSWLKPSEIQELRKLPLKDTINSNDKEPEYHGELVSSSVAASSLNGKHSKEKSVFISLPDESIHSGNIQERRNVFVVTTKHENAGIAVSANQDNRSKNGNTSHSETQAVDKQPQRSRRRTKRFSLKDAAIFIGLPILGVLTGIGIKEFTGNKLSQNEIVPAQPAEQQNVNDTNEQAIPGNNGDGSTLSLDESGGNLTDQTTAGNNLNQPVVKPGKSTKKTKESAKNPNAGDIEENTSAASDNARNSKTRDEEVKQPETISPAQLASMVSVSNNDYKTGAFGGIKDLQLTVTNDSKYILDKVIVQIQYLKPNEETVRTETVNFKSVPPNGSQTITVDKSNRGVKIRYKIIKIDPGSAGNVAGL
ncbi:MAG TPA: GYF domain-containing protein [Chitinophagaceae bacterium]|nr:GYF domain-containing protein [Chitinophagaceae bacterium]